MNSCHTCCVNNSHCSVLTIYILFYIECIKKRFGEKVLKEKGDVIRRKCNQKCIDIANKKMKVKKEAKAEP